MLQYLLAGFTAQISEKLSDLIAAALTGPIEIAPSFEELLPFLENPAPMVLIAEHKFYRRWKSEIAGQMQKRASAAAIPVLVLEETAARDSFPKALFCISSDGEAVSLGSPEANFLAILKLLSSQRFQAERQGPPGEITAGSQTQIPLTDAAALQTLERTSPSLGQPQYNPSELIAALSHEIRNPMTAISINTQYMQMAFQQTETQKEIYADILKSIEKLDLMISELADFTQQALLRLQAADLNQLLAEALAQNSALLKKRNIQVTTHFDPSLPRVDLDALRFRRALSGLIEHCCYAVDENGAIALRSQLLPEAILLEISRSGPGLSARRLETLFDPAVALKSPESGFGMALVRKILNEHRCKLEIESKLEGRTRFLLYYPLFAKTST
jgi:signal transduction histidine kinase